MHANRTPSQVAARPAPTGLGRLRINPCQAMCEMENSKSLDQDLNVAKIVQDIVRLRDALNRLSLALKDYRFETDSETQAEVRLLTQRLFEKAKQC